MEIVRKAERRTLMPLPSVSVHEYDMQDSDLSGAVAEIRGRYPSAGFVVNQGVKELAYVVGGRGTLHLRGTDYPLETGDEVLLDKGEAFAWSGEMTLFIATAPRFDPAQYVACFE